MNKLTKGEIIALETFCSVIDVPENKSFDTILEDISKGEAEYIGVWQPFEDWNNEDFSDLIRTLAENIDEAIRASV